MLSSGVMPVVWKCPCTSQMRSSFRASVGALPPQLAAAFDARRLVGDPGFQSVPGGLRIFTPAIAHPHIAKLRREITSPSMVWQLMQECLSQMRLPCATAGVSGMPRLTR